MITKNGSGESVEVFNYGHCMKLTISIQRSRPLTVAAFGCLLLAGCGGASSNAPKAPKTIQSPPMPANINARPAAQDPPPQQAAKNDPGGKAGSKSQRPRAEHDPFADVDPKNRFEIAGEEPLSEIGPAALRDRFTVGELAPGTSSADFEIAAIAGESTNSSNAAAKGPAKNENFQLPSGFEEAPGYGYSDQGLPLRIRCEKTGGLMALVSAGLAHVGSTDGPPETQPLFTPFLETYYMDVTEVTLGEYQKFRDEIKAKKNTRALPALNDGQDPNLPALGLPFGNAQGFAHWAGQEIPTEAEFENAARGPDGWRHPWGNTRAVWHKARPTDLIVPVASFPTDQSPYGIYDLAGNAREWCSDNYSDTAHQEAEATKGKTLRNWTGPKKGASSSVRVIKGNGPDWSAWHRAGRAATEKHPDVGFRCVLRVKVPQPGDSKGD